MKHLVGIGVLIAFAFILRSGLRPNLGWTFTPMMPIGQFHLASSPSGAWAQSET